MRAGYPPPFETEAAGQLRSAAFFVGFSASQANLEKFNQLARIRAESRNWPREKH
jgi:hypothetical protein